MVSGGQAVRNSLSELNQRFALLGGAVGTPGVSAAMAHVSVIWGRGFTGRDRGPRFNNQCPPSLCDDPVRKTTVTELVVLAEGRSQE